MNMSTQEIYILHIDNECYYYTSLDNAIKQMIDSFKTNYAFEHCVPVSEMHTKVAPIYLGYIKPDSNQTMFERWGLIDDKDVLWASRIFIEVKPCMG